MDSQKLLEIRKKADEILREKGRTFTSDFTDDLEKLVEELNIYHIELEMQNQELQQTNQKLILEQQKYKDLYMEAPIAYFTINETGNIIELNLAAANLLQLPIQKFRYTSIFPYISEDSKPNFVQSFKRFFSSNQIEYGEISFINASEQTVYAKLNAVCYFDAELNTRLCRCAVTDITEIKQYKEEIQLQKQLNQSQQFLIEKNIEIENLNEELRQINESLIEAKEKIQESENVKQMLFEILPIGLALAKMNGNLIYVNLAYTNIIGYTVEETLNLSYWDITPEKYADQEQIQLNNLNTKGFYGPYEKEYKQKSGKLVPVRLIGRIVTIDNEKFIWSSIEDISQRIRAEEMMKAERNQFLSLLNAIPEPIYVSDYETSKILFANNAKKELFGKDILGKLCYNVFHGKDAPCELCHKKDLLRKNNELVRSENYYPTVQKYFYNVDKLINWHDGQVAKFQISFDLTEIKRIEQQIRKLSIAVEQNPATIVITDTAGNIEYVNPKFTELTGYTSEEAKGQNPRILKSGKTNDAIYKDLWQTISNGKVWKGEFINKKKNGEELIESALIAPILNEKGVTINYIAIKEDITEKKQLQNELLQEKQYLQTIIDTSPTSIWFKDTNNNYVHINKSAADICGKPICEVEGKHASEIFPEEAEQYYSDDLEVISEGKPKLNIIESATTELGTFWLQTNKIPWFNREGNIQGVIHFAQDITKMIETELALAESGAKFRTLFKTVPIGISVTDSEGNLIENNAISEKILGISTDEHNNRRYDSADWKIIRQDFSDMPPAEFASVRALNENKRIENIVMGLKKPDNQINWISVTAEPLNIKNYGVIIAYIDITHLKNTEIALKESETLLKDAQKVGNVGHYDFDIQTNKLTWSEKTFAIYEFSPEEFEVNFENVVNQFHPEDRQKILDEYFKTIEQKTDLEITHRIITKSGKIKYVTQRANTKYDNSGKPIRSLGTVLDVTVLKEKENILIELNATKDKFFSIIAHDLKNPFNSLLGFSEMLENNAFTYPPEKIKKFAKNMHNSAKHAYTLLENLLEWARLQTGAIKPKMEKVNVSELIYEVKLLCESIAKSKQIYLQKQEFFTDSIDLDREMIKTVLRNLITNAIKFTFPKGTITIKSEKVENDILFTISDTGIGIEQKHIDKLFRIDSKLSKKGTAEESGTGLGLILCKEFIDKHKGKIWVESEFGLGSSFIFSLPLFNELKG